ncbi:MAG: hypothetical protein IJW43_00895 [Clostridia bacterium]|nr:hypothetical protein [Clostridia bacterium]
MDKFGIFKLLNSFFDFYKQNSAKEEGSSSSSFPTDFSLGDLGKAFSSPPQKSQDKEKKQKSETPPLQSEMLLTIRNHEKIERRVKKESNLLR